MQHPGRRKQGEICHREITLVMMLVLCIHTDTSIIIPSPLHFHLSPSPIYPSLTHCHPPFQEPRASMCVFVCQKWRDIQSAVFFCLHRDPSAAPWLTSYGFPSSASAGSNTSRSRPSWSKRMKSSTCTPSMTEDCQAKRPWLKTDTSSLFLELGEGNFVGRNLGGEEVGFLHGEGILNVISNN